MIFEKHINRYYLKNIISLVLGILVLLVEDYLILQVPQMYQWVINGINNGVVDCGGTLVVFDLDFVINRIGLPLLGLVLAMFIGRIFWRNLFFGAAIRVTADLRERMFDRARLLSAEYYSRNKVGNMMSLFTNDLDTINECFGHGLVMGADALIIGTMSITKMFRMNKTMTLIAMVPMVILLITALVVGRYMTQKWRQRQEAFSKLSDFTQERFSGIGVVKAFVKEAVEMMAFQKLNRENEKANVKHTQASVLMRTLSTLFIQSCIGVILGYGGYLVYHGVFNAGQIVEFTGYFNQTIFPIMCISELIDMASRGKASAVRIGALLDAQPDVVDREDARSISALQGAIEIKNLTFCYPGETQPVLRDISVSIPAGEKVGIVGRTGAGKTTLVELLMHTYNVPDGTIFVDGQDINSLKIHDLREGFAYVPQDNFLFSDTIENNIAFGVDSLEGVEDAAILADVDENIREFTKGYQTMLGERGVTVSGGQKQRISIARALLRNAPVLIMDDSVSAVDTKTEKVILENMHRIRGDKTTLLIAHRISTVEKMDRILLLEEGRLVAQGTHAELLETCPAYEKLVRLQQLEAEGGAHNV